MVLSVVLPSCATDTPRPTSAQHSTAHTPAVSTRQLSRTHHPMLAPFSYHTHHTGRQHTSAITRITPYGSAAHRA
eukprot:2685910-Rhodomonas_salina.1